MPPAARRAPQDRKPKAGPQADGSFVWFSSKGVAVHLPSMTKVEAGFIRANRKLPDIDFVFTVIEHVLDGTKDEKQVLAAIDSLNTAEINTMWLAWQAAEGATFPES